MSGGWIVLGFMVLGGIASTIGWYSRVQRSDLGSISRRRLPNNISDRPTTEPRLEES